MTPGAATRALVFDQRLLSEGTGFVGRIEATFTHSAVACDGQMGRWLTLVAGERPLVPFGVRVPWGRSTFSSLTTGARLTLAHGRLQAGDEALILEGNGVSLALHAAPIDHRTFARQLTGLGDVWSATQLADERFAHLLDAWLGEKHILDEEVRALSGLGPGATPSGDDLLVGASAMARRLVDGGLLGTVHLSRLLDALDRLPADTTTPLAREMIFHASGGHFVEPLRDLVQLLGREGAERQLVDARSRLARVGAQTGSDLLAGVVAVGRRWFART